MSSVTRHEIFLVLVVFVVFVVGAGGCGCLCLCCGKGKVNLAIWEESKQLKLEPN